MLFLSHFLKSFVLQQKLVRVINLWQKHKVFPDDLLKKFLVMVEAGEEDLPELYKDEIEALQKSSKKSPTSGWFDLISFSDYCPRLATNPPYYLQLKRKRNLQ